MNLRSIDLNLLVVFDAIYSERNVTRASEKICLSQSATSNALTRLRLQLKDDLFLRSPSGLRPTPRSHELAPRIHAILADLQDVLEPQAFDPATATRDVSIAVVDFFSIVIAPILMGILTREAPGIRLRIVPTVGRSMVALDQAEVDFAAASFGNIPERMGHAQLIQDNYSCLVRKGHPLIKKKCTLRQYARASHLLVSPRGDARGFVDEELAKSGLTRHVGLVIDHYAAAPAIVAQSDLILTAPTLVVKRFKSSKHIMFPCPVSLPAAFRGHDLIWHRKLNQHPALDWMLETIKRAAAEADLNR